LNENYEPDNNSEDEHHSQQMLLGEMARSSSTPVLPLPKRHKLDVPACESYCKAKEARFLRYKSSLVAIDKLKGNVNIKCTDGCLLMKVV